MNLKQLPDLNNFLSTYFPDTDPDTDEQTIRNFIAKSSPDRQQRVIAQTKTLLKEPDLSLEELGTEANRWFAEPDEARAWLNQIVSILEGAQGADSSTIIVKDSNGTPLNEGDSVVVIKDLKVKGGSSDLKRGTTIRKIHLISDPEVIECRVDGSTLVLKTCFLRKS